mgnify:CR=1 FL=1
MTKITEEQVGHIAKLARLEVSDAEVKKFTGQLSNVFEYMEILQDVNTDGVPETSQVTGLENVSDEDKLVPWQASGEDVKPAELLQATELPVEGYQVLVQSVIKK